MPYKNLQSLMKKTDEQCVKDWIAGLNEGSKNYAVYVLTLIEWGKTERWQSGEDMLNRWKRLRRGRNEDTRNEFVKIFHHYVETKKFTRKKSDYEKLAVHLKQSVNAAWSKFMKGRKVNKTLNSMRQTSS